MRLQGAGSAAVILLAGMAAAQDGRHPASSGDTRAAVVETIVTDKKGNYIRDLTAKEFRVWEDGKEQPVIGASLPSAAASWSPEDRNYMLVLFDNTSTDEAHHKQIKAALSDFLSDRSQEVWAAVAVYNGALSIPQDFTADAGLVRKAVEAVPSPTARSGGTAASSTDQLTLMARTFLIRLAVLAKGMAPVPGRKALVLLIGGLYIPDLAIPEFKAALTACNQANVAAYPVDVRGLTGRAGATGAPGGLWAGLLPRIGAAFAARPVQALAAFQRTGVQVPTSSVSGGTNSIDTGINTREALDTFAADTGGFVIRNSNDFAAGLRRIAAERRESYTVAYTPKQNAKAGCRELRVRVSRSGAQVRARKSYCVGGQ